MCVYAVRALKLEEKVNVDYMAILLHVLRDLEDAGEGEVLALVESQVCRGTRRRN